jgi:hypothetical protein
MKKQDPDYSIRIMNVIKTTMAEIKNSITRASLVLKILTRWMEQGKRSFDPHAPTAGA